MNLDKFTGAGSTPSRRAFWDKVTDAVLSSQKREGRNASIQEHQGQGTVINFPDQTPSALTGACCRSGVCTIETQASCEADGGDYQGDGTPCDPNPCPDFSVCTDLPPDGPGPPTHINVVAELGGSCADVDWSGTQTFDQDLEFAEVGANCAFPIFDNGFGAFWTGEFIGTCTLDAVTRTIANNGSTGSLLRDRTTGQWSFGMDVFEFSNQGSAGVGTCDGCFFLFSPSIFEAIAGPTGTFIFNLSDNGATLTITVTLT